MNPNRAPPAKKRLPSITLLTALAWTVSLAGSLAWNLVQEKRQVMDLAYADARSSLNKDISFRRWATRHGGVYVPLTKDQPSIPWLAHVPGRDVRTTEGKVLTLINPASMMRQIMDGYATEYGIRGRITGLKYLNPGNAPDAWEREQLEVFTRGERTETWEIAELDGQLHLRHLRAMPMEPGCEKCHAVLGYKLGDMRGATGINLPLAPYYDKYDRALKGHVAGHLALWLLGLAGIVWGGRIVRQRELDQATHQAERERSAVRYRIIFDQARDGIVIIDPKTLRFIEFNTVAHRQLGYERSEFGDLAVHAIEGKESPAEVAKHAELIARHGADTFETIHRRKDGTLRNVLVNAQIISIDGAPVVHCTFRDITIDKRNEAELAAYRLHLEQLVAARTAELAAKNQKLEGALEQLKSTQNQLVQAEKLSSLGALVAGVAHELNTPIGNARTVASALSEQAVEFGNVAGGGHLKKSDLNEFVQHVSHGTHLLDLNLIRAADLIHSFKQVAADRTSEQRRTFDLAQVLEEVIATLRPSLKRTQFLIALDAPPGIIMDGYPGPVGQIVVNLVDNAIVHGFAGRESGRITIGGRVGGDGRIQLSIEDDGNGIAAEHLPRIYDPFFTTRLGQGGSGLGLNIVHTLVEGVLGGEIAVSSAPQRGTRFEIRMPRSAPEKKPAMTATAPDCGVIQRPK